MWIGIFILCLTSIFFLGTGISIRRGNISLIHNYHIKNVKTEDKINYGKMFSKGMFAIAIGLLISAAFIYSEFTIIGLCTIFASLAIGIMFMNKAKKNL